jgi:hypothetical protein
MNMPLQSSPHRTRTHSTRSSDKHTAPLHTTKQWSHTKHSAKGEQETLRYIKGKLTINNAMLVKSDKGNSVIIIHQKDYQLINTTLHLQNNFEIHDNGSTDKYQETLPQTNIKYPQ